MIDLKEVAAALEVAKALGWTCGGTVRKTKEVVPLPFREGDAIMIRTVTMIQIGVVKAIGTDFITLDDGGWAADTGRFAECLKSGTLSEFERAPSWFLVGRGAIVDVFPWSHPTPKATK